jgi:hypothetical protein
MKDVKSPQQKDRAKKLAAALKRNIARRKAALMQKSDKK